MRRLLSHAWVIALATALLATGLAEGLYRDGSIAQFEHRYTDLWHRLAGKREPPRHTALVMLDDPTLNENPDEPLVFWTPHFAKAVTTLHTIGTKAIVIDFLFSASPERWFEKLGLTGHETLRNYDRAFREQINRGGVLLAGFKIGTGDSINDFILPSPDYLLALPKFDVPGHVGLANLRSDPDGPVRRFVLLEAPGEFARKEGLPRLAFGALAAVRATERKIDGKSWRFGDREIDPIQETRITFAGPPGTFHAVSFRKLLAPDAEKDPEVKALAGKVVVIGAGFAGINDVHPIPYSTSITGGTNGLMAGAEVQANIIETLLSGRFIDDVPAITRLFAFALVFGSMAIVGTRLPPSRLLIFVLLVATISALASYILFRKNLLFPLAHLQIGMLVVLIGLSAMRLTREERERKRISQMFGRYVSPQVMTAMLSSPKLPELGGQVQQITVLFSDIRGFTTISEKLSATEVVELLNTYFELACKTLMAEGATIDKFIGDAIMAEFGAPLAQPDHALRAVRAAIALRAVADEFQVWFKQRFANHDLPEFDIGIGLHSGEAVVGNIGSASLMGYTAIGDTVNVAARLESMTRQMGCPILASRDTVAAAGRGVRTGEGHSLPVKGRDQPVQVYEILGMEN